MSSLPNKLPDLSPYRAISKIGEGGTGCVYLAEEPRGSSPIALKVLHPEFIQRRALVDDFLRVTKTVGGLQHPNIVIVLNTGVLNSGEPFVAMEYLKGRDLGEQLAQIGSLAYPNAVQLMGQVCAGLALVHRQGLLHLDIKPNNIFILDSSKDYLVKILDFGTANLLVSQRPQAPKNRNDPMVVGTPEYRSPEQACGQSVDQRSDVYSLGVAMYEALSGRTPFWSHSVSDVIAQHVRCEPAGLFQQPHTPAIPDGLIQLVLRCLKKDPDKRFQSMDDLSIQLSTIPMDTGDKKRVTIRTCPKCSARYPEDKFFCSNDGARLSEVKSVAGQETPEASSGIGSVLGSYRLVKLLGEGGMGRVYLAEHVRLGRKVALKMLRAEYASNREAVTRFFREARAVNRINHENIVEITDFVEEDGGHNYYIMEYLEGRNLGDLMRVEGKLPASRVLGIGVQISKALSAAHHAGVIHRDLKSENIFLVERGGQIDFVKLLDFGVAKLTAFGSGQSIHKTASGIIIGTPEYMSPEQASGLEVDYRSDIYSLGVILLEMVTGINPFSVNAKSFGEVLVRHLTLKPPRLSEIADGSIHLPKQFEDFILKCLEKEPDQRPQNMDDVEEQLRQIADQESLQIEAYVSLPLPKRRYLGKAVALGVAGAVLVGGAIVAARLPSGEKNVLRPSASTSTQSRSSPSTENALPVPANPNAESARNPLALPTEISKAADDTAVAPIPTSLPRAELPPGLNPESEPIGDGAPPKLGISESNTGALTNSAHTKQTIPSAKTAASAQKMKKSKVTKTSVSKSKRRAVRSDTRATLNPFAEE